MTQKRRYRTSTAKNTYKKFNYGIYISALSRIHSDDHDSLRKDDKNKMWVIL